MAASAWRLTARGNYAATLPQVSRQDYSAVSMQAVSGRVKRPVARASIAEAVPSQDGAALRTDAAPSAALLSLPAGDVTVNNVMTRMVVVTTPETLLGDILENFAHYTGLPVVEENSMHCVGMISNIDMYKKQRGRSGNVANTPVKDVMTSPVVAVFPETPLSYAAGLMLKYKVHRLPVIDQQERVVGIITRADIFQSLTSSGAPADSFRLVP